MRIIGCDLHPRQQTLAMLDTTTGEVVKTTLQHEGNNVREFYCKLPRPVRVGIEATGSIQWFVNLMEELRIECRLRSNALTVRVDFKLMGCLHASALYNFQRDLRRTIPLT